MLPSCPVCMWVRGFECVRAVRSLVCVLECGVRLTGHSWLEFRFRVGVRTLAICVLSRWVSVRSWVRSSSCPSVRHKQSDVIGIFLGPAPTQQEVHQALLLAQRLQQCHQNGRPFGIYAQSLLEAIQKLGFCESSPYLFFPSLDWMILSIGRSWII